MTEEDRKKLKQLYSLCMIVPDIIWEEKLKCETNEVDHISMYCEILREEIWKYLDACDFPPGTKVEVSVIDHARGVVERDSSQYGYYLVRLEKDNTLVNVHRKHLKKIY